MEKKNIKRVEKIINYTMYRIIRYLNIILLIFVFDLWALKKEMKKKASKKMFWMDIRSIKSNVKRKVYCKGQKIVKTNNQGKHSILALSTISLTMICVCQSNPRDPSCLCDQSMKIF